MYLYALITNNPDSMDSDKWLVIVNPNAGSGKCGRDWHLIDAILQKKCFKYQAIFTERRYHAILLSRDLIKQGFRKIIVVGGDGTLNEVINGLFAQDTCPPDKVIIGMVPVGTGNDWARMFSIPNDYEKAAGIIQNCNIILQDAGKVLFRLKNRLFSRYFINIAGTGFDAVVAKKTNDLKERGKSGAFLYFYNLFISLLHYRSTGIIIEVDGKRFRDRIFSLNIGICRYNGGVMMQVPNADPTDGLFDITVIRRIGKLSVIRNLGRLYNGTIINHPKVRSMQGKKVSVYSNTPVYLETDGESLGHTPLEFDIIPSSISIISGKISA